jgi:hypothetical protein
MVVTNIYFVIEYCRTQLLAALLYEWQQYSTVEVLELALLYSTNLEVRQKVLEEDYTMF